MSAIKKNHKALFIKFGKFSYTNDSVLQQLIINFPDYKIDVIDIFKEVLSRKDSIALFHCFKEYGRDIILGRKSIKDTYLRTPYILGKIKRVIHSITLKSNYKFTFQTQSIFDASIPDVPHFVYTDHTHLANLSYPGFNYNGFLGMKWITLEKMIYQNATLNFTMSSNISESIIRDYSCSPEKVVCVFCGSNINVNHNEIIDANRFSNKNILFVGVDWHRKGGPVLVEAFKKVLGTYPDAKLTIVGCDPILNLPNCNVVGRVPLDKVKDYFYGATIFCLPTTVEPFGIVFLEAMANRLPVIGSKIGALPDFIHEEKNGYLIEPNNVDQLYQSIISLLSSVEKCNAFGDYGHKLFWDKYTWGKTGILISDNIRKFID